MTADKINKDGIYELSKALEDNKALLYLNLCNTNLNKECGEILMNMMEHNSTIIALDLD